MAPHFDLQKLSLRHALGIAILSLLVVVGLRRDAAQVDGNQDASFKVVDLPGKGMGLVATRDIAVMHLTACTCQRY